MSDMLRIRTIPPPFTSGHCYEMLIILDMLHVQGDVEMDVCLDYNLMRFTNTSHI